MNELALFAGAGGGILGGKLLGWRTVCAVEWEKYPACVLAARQNDGILSPFPIWDDVQTFDGKPWRGIVDVVSGGFPCQDISAAGKGVGIDGERSGMWKEMARIISEIRPRFAFVENSPMLTSRGLGTVLGNLSEMGYDAEWGVISAADIGANHLRERIWIVAKQRDVANSQSARTSKNQRGLRQRSKGASRGQTTNKEMAHSRCELWNERDTANLDSNKTKWATSTILNQSSGKGYGEKQWWEIEPNVGRVANGVASGVDRLKAIGNGQVPLCAATAWNILNDRLANRK
jgi:DNA (cytosine-5)-methyltransferase 1